MLTHTPLLRALCLLALLATGPAALAASEDFGDYTVHYSVVNSTFIDPQIAAQYDIVRGPNRAFLNISVMDKSSGSPVAVAAQVSGARANLMQQSEAIDFIEVREGSAIYYLGQFRFSNAEDLNFELRVSPEGSDRSHTLEWTQTLYNN